ncbi:MAG: S26 family signal peptidase, partial [Oscillospiraceae bacterium]|nr:S26 family signal peptidase [Oscillospiraceae bacterium]
MSENMEPMQEMPKEKYSFKLEVYDWMQCIVVALVACILIFTFVGRIIGVDGGSMLPTLEDGDKIIIISLYGKLEYGDIVVLTKREFSREPIVKRV